IPPPPTPVSSPLSLHDALPILLRPQHYLQACAHLSILLYWGWYWREVYHSAPLIAAQLAFAYAFDALLTWSRRDTYTLGFGPFRSEEHTSELQSRFDLVCRLLL